MRDDQMNKNTFATRKRRLNYAEKVISPQGKSDEPGYQQNAEGWLNQRKNKLIKVITKADDKEVRED